MPRRASVGSPPTRPMRPSRRPRPGQAGVFPGGSSAARHGGPQAGEGLLLQTEASQATNFVTVRDQLYAARHGGPARALWSAADGGNAQLGHAPPATPKRRGPAAAEAAAGRS